MADWKLLSLLVLSIIVLTRAGIDQEDEVDVDTAHAIERRDVSSESALRSLLNGRRKRPNKQAGRGNRKTNIKDMEPDEFLKQFGYAAQTPDGVAMGPETRKSAIRHFQRMTGLRVTGRLDNATRTKMKQRRCGMPDATPSQTIIPPDGVARDASGSPLSYHVPGFKWKKTTLTWKTTDYSSDLSTNSQRRAFYNAFKYWTDITPLTANEVSGEADFNLKFASGEHGDGGGNAFDGNGGVLAHAYYPESGDTHFDEDEDWTEYTDAGTNLEIVAAHEIGHALGLGHSTTTGALMAPYYQGYDANFRLHDDDIRGIQTLYGSADPPVIPPTTTTTTRRPRVTRPSTTVGPSTTRSPNAKPDPCTVKFDAMLQAHDSRIYVFRAQWIMSLNDWAIDRDFPRLSRKVYNSPPINIGAAVYSFKTRYTYFFKGTKVWKYFGFAKVQRKIVTTPGYPKGIQSAFMDRRGRIILFKGADFFIFNEETMDVESTRGQSIQSEFPGAPPNIEAAVRLRDGYVYFIKGYRYRKYDEHRRVILPGYPKDKAPAFMGQLCGGAYVPK